MQFNLQRFTQLLRRDFIIYKKPVLYFIFGSLIILSLITFFAAIDEGRYIVDQSYWEAWYSISLMGGGLLLTSAIFWEFKSPAGRVQYLSLPASAFEKCMSRWLYSVLLYPIIILSILGIVKLITDLITGTPLGIDLTFFPFKEVAMGYFLLHSLVFMFAIWFNKYVAAKSIISGFLIILIATFIFAIAHRVIFNNLYEGLFSMSGSRGVKVIPNPEFQEFVENFAPKLAYAAALIVPIFFYTVSYFKMKEKVA